MDLDRLEAQLDAANAESGPWAIEPDVADNGGLWIEALGDGGEPGEAAALFLRDIRETVLKLIENAREDSRALDRWCEWQDFVIAAAKQLGVYEELSEKLDKSYQVSLKPGAPPADTQRSG